MLEEITYFLNTASDNIIRMAASQIKAEKYDGYFANCIATFIYEFSNVSEIFSNTRHRF